MLQYLRLKFSITFLLLCFIVIFTHNSCIPAKRVPYIVDGQVWEELIWKENGVEDIVKILPSIPYKEALAEMLSCDGLLILQASNCNHQIPAKIYEYLRAQRPILALTDITGDTAQLLLDEGIEDIAALDDKDKITEGLLEFIKKIKANNIKIPSLSSVKKYSRQSRTAELACILNKVIND